jgi:hypothetical protein
MEPWHVRRYESAVVVLGPSCFRDADSLAIMNAYCSGRSRGLSIIISRRFVTSQGYGAYGKGWMEPLSSIGWPTAFPASSLLHTCYAVTQCSAFLLSACKRPMTPRNLGFRGRANSAGQPIRMIASTEKSSQSSTPRAVLKQYFN